MSKCRDMDQLFAPYVDGDAPPDARASVDAHLDRCPPCRDQVAGERTARDVLMARRSGLRGHAPQQLRAKCAAKSRRSPRSVLAAASRRWVPLSLAATLLLAVAGAFVFGLNDSVQALAAQLTIDHVKCFQFAPERLTHADSARAGQNWNAVHGWSLHVPPSSVSAHLELLGVRRCIMSTGNIAHVLYKWRGEPLSVFVLPRTLRSHAGNDAGQDEIVESFGHEAVVWSRGERTYVVLVRGRPADLEQVVRYVKITAR